jgi:hypothetical protein
LYMYAYLSLPAYHPVVKSPLGNRKSGTHSSLKLYISNDVPSNAASV